MEWLSGEPLFAALGSSSTSQIIDLCVANRELNTKLCENEDFWQYRYIAERGTPDRIPASWKRAYLRPSTIYVFGLTSDDGQERIVSLTFPKSIADIKIRKGSSVGLKHNRWTLEDLLVLTTDGEVYYLDSNYQFKRIPLNETIAQISIITIQPRDTNSIDVQFLLLTDNSQIYLVHDEGGPQLLELPVSIKFISTNGRVFLSTDNKLYQYYPETQRIKQYGNVQLTSQFADNITQIIDYARSIYFVANGQYYGIIDHNVQPFGTNPSPIRKMVMAHVALLESGQLWNIRHEEPYSYYRNAPLAQDVSIDFPKSTTIIIDKLDNVWVNRSALNDLWVKVDMPTKVTHTSDGAVWGDIKPLVTSFAHFSQLVNRGKIPEFKVPPQLGVNEPYVDTFLIPDLEGYEYEVTARYDPQTGQMTAP